MQWEKRFVQVLNTKGLSHAIDTLNALSSDHGATPDGATKACARALIEEQLDARALKRAAFELADMKHPVAKELACGLLAPYYKTSPKKVFQYVSKLADDENWEVREYAAGLLASVLDEHFDVVLPQLHELRGSDSPNIRRAVVLAAKEAGKSRRPERATPLLDLLYPLLEDRNEYVRKNLGPFAIGDGLLRYYPTKTLSKLRAWAKRKHEVVRWNVAMTLSAAEARKHLPEAMKILHDLAQDERRFVWRAVAAAVRKHASREPGIVTPYLRRWSKDPAREAVSEVVFKYVPS